MNLGAVVMCQEDSTPFQTHFSYHLLLPHQPPHFSAPLSNTFTNVPLPQEQPPNVTKLLNKFYLLYFNIPLFQSKRAMHQLSSQSCGRLGSRLNLDQNLGPVVQGQEGVLPPWPRLNPGSTTTPNPDPSPVPPLNATSEPIIS